MNPIDAEQPKNKNLPVFRKPPGTNATASAANLKTPPAALVV